MIVVSANSKRMQKRRSSKDDKMMRRCESESEVPESCEAEGARLMLIKRRRWIRGTVTWLNRCAASHVPWLNLQVRARAGACACARMRSSVRKVAHARSQNVRVRAQVRLRARVQESTRACVSQRVRAQAGVRACSESHWWREVTRRCSRFIKRLSSSQSFRVILLA
eukprot:2424708-Pleurochrysis_carterae.AAC.1